MIIMTNKRKKLVEALKEENCLVIEVTETQIYGVPDGVRQQYNMTEEEFVKDFAK